MKFKKFNIFTKIGRLNRRLSKYDKISSLLSNLEYSKKEIADIVAFAEFIDFKKQGR